MNTLIKSAIGSLLILAFVNKADAQILGVQFQGQGTALTSNQFAGVVSQANFNVITGETGSALALNDSAGNLTNATLTFSTTDMYSTGTGNSTPDKTLLSGKIGPVSSPANFTINNLGAGTYNLIVYTVNDTAAQQGTFTVGSTSYSIADQAASDFDGTYIQGTNTDSSQAGSDVANYVLFSNISVAQGGSITFTSTTLSPGGQGAGAFNGFQLIAVAVPEPSDVALLLGGLVVLSGLHRMRKSFEKC